MAVKILIVEDEWLIADLLESMVSDLGYEVVGPAPDVECALGLIENERPDAAMLDVSLGEGRSFAIADVLVERGAPFLFLTGYLDVDLPAKYRAAPIVNKPVLMADLRGPLRRLAEMTAASR